MPDISKNDNSPTAQLPAESLETNPETHTLSLSSEKGKNTGWVKSILPLSIATGPVGIIIQLLILNNHGTVIDVSLAITLFSAVSIPSAIFWGFATDRFHKRKPIIVASSMATSAILILFLFARTLYCVTILYALFSFATTAVTTPLNLLIMETSPKQKWSNTFAWFSMISSIGQTAGLILGTAWSSFLLLNYLVIPLAILSIASAGLSAIMIKEPSVVFERQMMILNKNSFFQRLSTIPYIFLKIPRLTDFKRVFRSLKYDLTRNVPILYFSIFMFYIASGLFNTSLVPSLDANKIPSLLIFFIITIVNIVQITSFKFAAPYAEKKSLMSATIFGLTIRSIGYASLGISFYFVFHMWYIIPALIFYSLSGGFAYSIYYTASNTMVFNTLNDCHNGSSLGVYSALVGVATMTGSLISGFASFYLGFSTTFIMASICLAGSIWLVSLLRQS